MIVLEFGSHTLYILKIWFYYEIYNSKTNLLLMCTWDAVT